MNVKDLSSVCRSEEYRIREEGKGCKCGGEHVPECLECPVRVKENVVARVSSVLLG